MLARIRILASGSSGNSALLSLGDTHLLIDAGLSGRRTAGLLRESGIEVEYLAGVCLSHEHGDHAKGVRGLSRQARVPFYACYETAHAIQSKLENRPSWKLFESGKSFQAGPLEVLSFPIPHDAYDPVCFFVSWGNGDPMNPRRPGAWVNDLGYVPDALKRRLAAVDVLIIEANHDEAMLEEDTRRPWSLKQRIRSRHGHLSNRGTLEALRGVEHPKWRHLCLSHLSRDCNDPSLVMDYFAPLEERIPGLSVQVLDPRASAYDPIHL